MLQTLLLFFVALILLAGVACLFISLLRRRFEECAPLALCSVFLVLYVLVISGAIRFALPVVALAAMAGIGLLLFGFLRKGNRDHKALERLFTPGFVAYFLLGMFSCMLMVLFSDGAFAWDEFSQWMVSVKELWLVDAGEAAFRTVASMPYYPPFSSLLQFFFLKVIGAYSEQIPYAVNMVIATTLLLPVLRTFPWKKWVQAIFCTAALCLIPLTIFVDGLGLLYVDCLMGLLLGYALFLYFAAPDKDLFTWLSVSAGICMLSMIKNVGVEVCLVPLAIIGADWFFVQRKAPAASRTKKQALLLFAACFLIMFLPHGVWHVYLRLAGFSADFAGGGDAGLRVSSFPQPYQRTGFRAAVARLFAEKITGNFTLSILSITAILLLVGLYLIRHERGKRDEKSMYFFVGGTVLGTVAYFAEITLAMVLTFNKTQVIVMQSLERYMDTYLLGMLFAFVAMLLERRREQDGMLCTLAVFAALLPFSAMNESMNFMDAETKADRRERMELYAPAIETLSALDRKTDAICYVDQGGNLFGVYYLRYLFAPMPVTYAGAWSIGEPTGDMDQSHQMIEAADWAKLVLEGGCSFVFLRNYDDYFIQNFSQFFASRDDITTNTLYRIQQTDAGGLLLVPAR